MAMEFATTGPMPRVGSDDSWLPWAPGVFLFARRASRMGDLLRLTLIAILGAIGTLARYALQGFVQVRAAGTFPYGTLLINLRGCFLLGLIGKFTLNRLVIPADWRVAMDGDFFGGYTTFSSFGWEPRRCWKTASGCARPHMSRPACSPASCYPLLASVWPIDCRCGDETRKV